MTKYRNCLNNQRIKQKYGTIYEDLKFKRSLSLGLLLEPTISQLRLIVFACSLTLYAKNTYFQIFTANALMTITIIHQYQCEVYWNPAHNFFMTFNEIFVALITYHVICFANLIEDLATLRTVGTSAIVTITVNIVVNFAYIFGNSIKITIRKAKTWHLNRKRRKLLIKFGITKEKLIN